MSQDVLLRIQSDGSYDLEIEGNDFKTAGGFETAIPVSLFTDARAPTSRVQDASRRRGWIGNLVTAATGRELGGLLWLLDQARLTRSTLNDARNFALGSLNWLREDGAVRGVNVDVVQSGTRTITIFITLTRRDDTTERYTTLWRATNASVIPNV